MSDLPLHVEEEIAAAEKRLTEVVRKETGRSDLVAVFDRRPLLRTEKRWPDDFRGFGTNVRPKKQK